MVNVARMMGLAMDPDEFADRYSLFEAETRRRIWWDVYYYDLYVFLPLLMFLWVAEEMIWADSCQTAWASHH